MKNILLVEDEVSIIKTFTKNLKDNYNINFAKNEPDAVKLFQKIKPDVVLLDLKLPDGEEGLIVLEKIRKYERSNKMLPCVVIIVSAVADLQNLSIATNLMIDGYISKPADADELNSVIKDKLSLRYEKDNIISALNEWKNSVDEDEKIFKLGLESLSINDIINEITHNSELGRNFRDTMYQMLFNLTREYKT